MYRQHGGLRGLDPSKIVTHPIDEAINPFGTARSTQS
jgi:hypothetical protein